VHYRGPYYIAFAHAAVPASLVGKFVYSTHLVVLSVEPTFRIVYVSNAFDVTLDIYNIAAKIVKDQVPSNAFVLPVSLLKEESGSYLLTVNVNDQANVLLRLTGIEGLMYKVIKQDSDMKPTSGPKPLAVQDVIFECRKDQTAENIIHMEI
jgi:hypothetical protein